MAIKASFIPGAGLLSVFGDDLDNAVTISRNAAGLILINGGAVPVTGGQPTVANTTQMVVFGQAGNDMLVLDESNGALPPAQMFGGTGNDTIVGGSGGDLLFGQAGNDTLLGKGGNDLLFGGAGNDTLTGGDGDDQVFGEGGNDRMIWNPGDDTDLFEGGDGTDTAEVNGGNGAEVFAATANGTRVRFDRLDPAPFSLDLGTTEKLVVNMNGGDDSFSATGNLANLISVTVDGGAGNDTILGSNGADTLIGGDGNDFIDGQQGNDLAQLGAGDDVFQWDPGDGSDTVEGGDGNDTMLFNGSAGNEIMELSANGGRTRLTRDLGTITMDFNDIERVQINALGGADKITVANLAATDVKQVDIDLAGTLGGAQGDGQPDQVIVNGTNGADQINVVAAGTTVTVTGLAAQVAVAHAEAGDLLVVNAGNGNDTINAATMPAGVIGLTIDAGAGNDTVIGSQGKDTILGGDGNDTVTGGRGDDVALLGAGNDTFIWNPGDGSDVVEGQAGTDTMLFNGANIAEKVDISANGGRARFFRDVATVTMDLDDVENIQFNALGGADDIVVGDLSGTDVKQVNLDLSAQAGSGQGDGVADTVTANGTQGNDTVTIASSGASVVVNGLPAKVTIAGAEGANDSLVINGQAGNDTINASGLNAGRVELTINGGAGDDTITGSKGNDQVFGGQGTDTARLGLGDDTFVWNPGDGNDTVDGQGGVDTHLFNGADINEIMDISANGGHARLTRNVGNITMDLDNVETIDVQAKGGADTITVNDLSQTDVSEVKIDLGGADNGADTIVLNATNGNDAIVVTNNNGVITVSGLGADVTITGFEANDRIVINGLGGDDVIEASGLSGMLLTADGGDGDDVLVGSPGNDTLLGGAGDDVLVGGAGQDVLDGGPGSNVVIQSAVLGQFMASSFAADGQGQASMPMADPASNQPPLLAQPHA